MKFCSILPIKNMDLMFEQPDMVMLLAHLSAKYPEYAKKAKEYKGYKILDNSIIELGEAFTMESLMAEAERVGADEIILPDVFRDGEATVKKAEGAIQWLKDHDLIGKYKIMAVAHGKNASDFDKAIEAFKNMREIDVIGIPKVLTASGVDRVDLAGYARNKTGKEVHLLGCWSTLGEYLRRDLSNIRSTDTCMPALIAYYGMGPYAYRYDRKIDLEEDEVDPDKYREVMRRFREDSGI